jgi:uncharacterized membrane protein
VPFGGFDAYPYYDLLTLRVSLEAIILSVFVLLSQNRQVARDRVHNQIESDVNLEAELEIAHLHERMWAQSSASDGVSDPRMPRARSSKSADRATP